MEDNKSTEQRQPEVVEHKGDIKDFVTTLGHDLAETYKELGSYVVEGVKGVGGLVSNATSTVARTLAPTIYTSEDKKEEHEDSSTSTEGDKTC